MAKSNPNKPRRNQGNKKGQGGLAKQARRNVNISYQPGLNAAYRGIDQANLDFQNQDLGVQSIYGGSQKDLEQLYPQYQNRTGNIADELQSGLAHFSSALNQEGLPASEVAANTAVYGTQGNNFINELASNDQRALQYDQSAERENTLSERYARQNLSQTLSDTQQGYYNRIADMQGQKQASILSELKDLQQNKAYSDLIAELTGNSLDSNNGPPGGNGNPNPNNGPVNNPTGPGGVQNGLGVGDTAAGGNNFSTGGQYPGNAIRNINEEDKWLDIPPWLRDTIRYFQGPDRWESVKGQPRRRRKIFRGTREHVQDLYNQTHNPPRTMTDIQGGGYGGS